MQRITRQNNSRGNTALRHRGQAAIFDGIMFLLLSTISVSLVFVFLNGYGTAQDDALRSSYTLAYIQDAAKSLFYIDVRTLATTSRQDEALYFDPNSGEAPPTVANGKPTCTTSDGTGCPYWNMTFGANPDDHCDVLSQYSGTTVADLLKKDLSDSDFMSASGDTSAAVCLDNHYGLARRADSTGAVQPSQVACDYDANTPKAHGKTALECAMKELMKPFTLAGYYYMVEIVDPTPVEHSIPIPPTLARITNYWQADAQHWLGCQDPITEGFVSNGKRQSFQVLTVSMPFRVPSHETIQDMRNFVLRICVWPGKT